VTGPEREREREREREGERERERERESCLLGLIGYTSGPLATVWKLSSHGCIMHSVKIFSAKPSAFLKDL
jgi:hypothetical protein